MNSKIRPYVIVISILLILTVLSNCTKDATPTSTTSPLVSPLTMDSPIAVPQSVNLPPEWNMTPESGKAMVRGLINMPDPPTALLGELFLAKTMPTNNPEIELLELDQDAAPRAIIARDSMAFVFVNVEPGRYGLIAWEPMNSMVLNDPKTGQTLYIDISAGQIVDLGALNFP